MGQGCQVGTALFSGPGGWSGGRVLLPAGTRSCSEAEGHQPLCSRFHTDQDKGAWSGASRRSDHNLVKRTFCSPSQRGLSVCSFLPSCPNPPTKFLSNVIAALCILKIVNLNIMVSVLFDTKRNVPILPHPQLLGLSCPAGFPELFSPSPPTCWQILLRILWLVLWIFPWSPAFSPPFLLPASQERSKGPCSVLSLI